MDSEFLLFVVIGTCMLLSRPMLQHPIDQAVAKCHLRVVLGHWKVTISSPQQDPWSRCKEAFGASQTSKYSSLDSLSRQARSESL